MIMNNLKSLIFVFIALIAFSSCSDDDNDINLLEIASDQVANLHAPQSGGQGQPISGELTKFNFATGQVTTSETDWDIAFRGTTIIVNGGVSLRTADEPARNGNAAAYIADGTFASVNEINSALFTQDSGQGYAIPSGSGNGWYLYNPQLFLIAPMAGKVLVFRTHDNKFAKVEILSYYKDAPANPDVMVDEGRYYTFNYIYQPNEGINTF